MSCCGLYGWVGWVGGWVGERTYRHVIRGGVRTALISGDGLDFLLLACGWVGGWVGGGWVDAVGVWVCGWASRRVGG